MIRLMGRAKRSATSVAITTEIRKVATSSVTNMGPLSFTGDRFNRWRCPVLWRRDLRGSKIPPPVPMIHSRVRTP